MTQRPTDSVKIYQFKITLSGMRPAIWRRFLVKGDISLAQLHDIVRCAMGWHDSHLHQFAIQEKRYGMREVDESERLLDERDYRLSDVIVGGRFEYLYDFGENWEHAVEVESVGAPEGKTRCPVCVDGARACPPEDVGGLSGYENLLEAIRDPKHSEDDDYRDWIGDDYNSEAFNVAAVNRRLRSFQR